MLTKWKKKKPSYTSRTSELSKYIQIYPITGLYSSFLPSSFTLILDGGPTYTRTKYKKKKYLSSSTCLLDASLVGYFMKKIF